MSLTILLFIDERSSSVENIKKIRAYLSDLKREYAFDLKIIDIAKKPYLAEEYKLIVTPALVRISPLPKQIIAGANLVEQLKKLLPKWLATSHSSYSSQSPTKNSKESGSELNPISYSSRLIELSDEIFRLKQEKEELKEQLRFKDQIIAMLAHDLRSPLTAASIALETLELSEHQPTEIKTKLKERLYEQAKRQFHLMNRMIGDLLKASKTVNAKLNLQPKPIKLQDLCQEIFEELRDRIQQNNQTLVQDIPQDLPRVYGDAELLRQLILNLLENAIKYTPPGGKIGCSILHRTSQKIQVTIFDTGPGIPSEKQERIFEGHFRLKRDQAKEGYGLGLSSCRKIVQAHYGQIWVESNKNGSQSEGSRFHFTLPVHS